MSLPTVTTYQKINSLDALIAEIQGIDDGGHGVNRLLLALRIFRQTLKLRSSGEAGDLDWLPNVKCGLRESVNLFENLRKMEAEAFPHNWHPGNVPQNPQQQIASVLSFLINELVTEVTLTEMLHPERAEEFEAERNSYYAMKRAVEEANRFD